MSVLKYVAPLNFDAALRDLEGTYTISTLADKYVYASINGKLVTVTGIGLSYNSNLHMIGGTVTGVSMTQGSVTLFTWTDLSYSASDFNAYAFATFNNAADTYALEVTMLSGNDVLYGGVGDGDLYGRAGNDVIYGGDGDDWLYGGTGKDRYHGDAGKDYVSFWDGAHGVKIDLRLTSGQVRDDGFGNIETATSVEGWHGSDFGDTMIGGSAGVTFYGGGGSDSLTGGSGNDTIWGGEGIDVLSGGTGFNVLYMWMPTTGHGVNVNLGKVSGQVLDDGFGNVETVNGFQDIWGSRFNDTLTGSSDSNLIWADTGNDRVYGGGGADWLYGDGGNDTLYGGTGVDELWGEEGRNVLSGGANADYFYFTDQNAEPEVQRQTVTDFAHGVDQIELDLDFGGFAAVGAVSAAQFRSGAGFTSATTATQRLIYNTTTGILYLDVDGAGGATAMQLAVFSNHVTLTATDFHLDYLA